MAIKVTEKTDYGFLFDSLNNNNSNASNNIFNAIDLSEYHSIKSGVYGKALKTYYAQQAEDTDSAKTEKDSSKKNSKESTAVDKLTEVNGNASALADSADKLITRGSDSLFRKKDITVKKEDGTSEIVEDYDADAIYNAVSDFAKKYNSFLTSMKNSGSDKIEGEVEGLTSLVEGYETSLNNIGITIGEDNKLSVAADKFKAADMNDVKKLFNGNTSFAYVASTRASVIGATANSEANVMKNYKSNGSYENALSSMGNLLDSMI